MKPMTNFDTADTSAIAAVVDKCIGKSSKRNAKEVRNVQISTDTSLANN